MKPVAILAQFGRQLSLMFCSDSFNIASLHALVPTQPTAELVDRQPHADQALSEVRVDGAHFAEM